MSQRIAEFSGALGVSECHLLDDNCSCAAVDCLAAKVNGIVIY
jgi:hypothetical protein